MKRAMAVLALVAVAVAAWFAWQAYEARTSDEEALAVSGTVEDEQIAVSALASGRVLKVSVREGERVKKGQVLFRLDGRVLDNQVEQAKAAMRAARTNYIQVRDDDDPTEAQIAAAKAQYDQARIAVDTAEVLASYAVVKAPAAGIASSVVADEGEIASPGQTLAVLSEPRSLKVSVFVPETEIGNVRIGDTATLTTDSSTGSFSGKVTFIASEAEFTPANIETKDQRVKLVYEVRLAVSDDSGTLKPGMPVDVEF